MADTQTEARQAPLALNAAQGGNWKFKHAPVAVMNEATTHHERIAYCYDLAIRVCTLVDLMQASDDGDLQRFGALLNVFSDPLARLLDRAGGDSYKLEKAGVL